MALLALNLAAQPYAPLEVGARVNGFQDDFERTSLGSNWTVRGADVFTVSNGRLQVATASGDPNHLLFALPGYNDAVQEVLARIQVRHFDAGCGFRRCRTVVPISVGHPFRFQSDRSRSEATRWCKG